MAKKLGMKSRNSLQTALAGLIALIAFSPAFGADTARDIDPLELEFRRAAVRRMVFDPAEGIELVSLRPERIVGPDAMHPTIPPSGGETAYGTDKGRLTASAAEDSESALWIGGFNPFATYELHIEDAGGSPEAGLGFADPDGRWRMVVLCGFEETRCVSARCVIQVDGGTVFDSEMDAGGALPEETPFVLRLQMLGAGMNALIEKDGVNRVIGQPDFVPHFDPRRKDVARRMETRLWTRLSGGDSVAVSKVWGGLTPGLGQADLRAITLRDGAPLIEDGRLWYAFSVRGRGLPHILQGVLSLDPSTFDVRFEGIVLFDRGDGLLRNDLASHIYYDELEDEWRGFTTGFSAYADPPGGAGKQILAIRSRRDPRRGLTVMEAKPTGLAGDFEDPHVIFDGNAGKWRMALCENRGNGYRAVMRESDRWDGGFEAIAGPVDVDTTGTLIQKIGSRRYVFFGSADRALYVYSYPDLRPLGELNVFRPPWTERTRTRVWPNIVPLPAGYPARYVALTMDRLNYPGIEGPNWTYGAMYLYHAHAPGGDGHPYEYGGEFTSNGHDETGL